MMQQRQPQLASVAVAVGQPSEFQAAVLLSSKMLLLLCDRMSDCHAIEQD